MLYHESKIWTSTLAPYRTHYLPVECTSTDRTFVNSLQGSFLHRHLFAYLSLSLLDIIRDGASGGDPKALLWTECGKKSVTLISVLTEIDGFSVRCFKVMAKLEPCIFLWQILTGIKLNHICTP